MKIEDFTTTQFPTPRLGYVYVFYWLIDGAEIPFYVGETDRFQGRMNDYRQAQFGAATDFIVGEAATYLNGKSGSRIVVRYKRSSDDCEERRKEQNAIIQELRTAGAKLLNGMGYDYQIANRDEERAKVQRFCDMLR
jgi:hypothetical protein